MSILLIFAFISGLTTITAPCIWPLLPIILSSTTSGGHKKPLGITLGIMTSFAFFTLTLSYIVKIIPFDPNLLRLFAVIVIGFLGLTLLIPPLSQILEGLMSRLSGKFASTSRMQSTGFKSGYVTGFSLGLVWSPCAGPILATIATLAATQSVNFSIILVTVVYVIGVGIPLFLFATLGRNILTKTAFLSKYTGRIQQVFGVIMILTAISIFTSYDKVLSAKLLNLFPSYSSFLNNLEGQESVKRELNQLKNNKTNSNLSSYGNAPEFTGVTKWLNTDKPKTMTDLKGKVVLVDFWTYTCINCIRTLPFVTSWYDKYNNPSQCSGTLRSSAAPSDLKDKCFVVIGVHTPEFEFEKKEENVLNAISQYKINYPVALDNNYSVWQSYNNQYWPAKYLIDSKGVVRYFHFGEGEYDKTEKVIQELLTEAGQEIQMPLTQNSDQTPKSQLTPETYLGLARMQGFALAQPTTTGTGKFILPKELGVNNWAFGGTWDIQNEYSLTKLNSTLEFKFLANKVFLVITPSTKSDIIKVSLDGKVVNTITADTAKLYTLVDTTGNNTPRLLHLDFQTPGTRIYAFTFGD